MFVMKPGHTFSHSPIGHYVLYEVLHYTQLKTSCQMCNNPDFAYLLAPYLNRLPFLFYLIMYFCHN